MTEQPSERGNGVTGLCRLELGQDCPKSVAGTCVKRLPGNHDRSIDRQCLGAARERPARVGDGDFLGCSIKGNTGASRRIGATAAKKADDIVPILIPDHCVPDDSARCHRDFGLQ